MTALSRFALNLPPHLYDGGCLIVGPCRWCGGCLLHDCACEDRHAQIYARGCEVCGGWDHR